MAWGSNWPSGKDIAKAQANQETIEWPKPPALTGLDLAIGERTILTTFEAGEVKHKIISHTELKSQGSNLIDSEGRLYFQCKNCLNIFNPQTKSFKTLNDKLDLAKWKRVWNSDGLGFKVYCTECKKEPIGGKTSCRQ